MSKKYIEMKSIKSKKKRLTLIKETNEMNKLKSMAYNPKGFIKANVIQKVDINRIFKSSIV